MARNFQSGSAPLSHPRTTTHTIIAICAVLVIAICSGLAYSHHEKTRSASLRTDQPINATEQSEQQALPEQTTAEPNQEKAEPMPADNNQTSPGVTNNSSSKTTVTINGETTTVEGNGSVNKNYTSEDGNSKVRINIKNSISHVKNGNSDKP